MSKNLLNLLGELDPRIILRSISPGGIFVNCIDENEIEAKYTINTRNLRQKVGVPEDESKWYDGLSDVEIEGKYHRKGVFSGVALEIYSCIPAATTFALNYSNLSENPERFFNSTLIAYTGFKMIGGAYQAVKIAVKKRKLSELERKMRSLK